MKKMIEKMTLLILVYSYGLIAGIVFHLSRKLKIIRVLHWERFPHRKGKLILVSNHPSILETFLLPLLFFRGYIFQPFKFTPWSTPDKKNFADPWYFFWIKSRIIPIPRGNGREELKALIQMKDILCSGGIVVLFAEGGRTHKGESFLYSEKGEKIRPLKNGVGWLALKTKATILPVWVEGTDKVMPNSPHRLFSFPRFWKTFTIKIGQPIVFEESLDSKEEVTTKIANVLLRLADE